MTEARDPTVRKYYLNMRARTVFQPVIALDLLAVILAIIFFVRIGVYSPPAFVALAAIIALLIIANHQYVLGALRTDWNFVELHEGKMLVRVAQLFGPASLWISYTEISEIRFAERLNVWWSFATRHFADFWPHRPPYTTSIGWFGPAPHVEVHLKRPHFIRPDGNRLFPLVTVLHLGVDDPEILVAELDGRVRQAAQHLDSTLEPGPRR